MSLLQQKLELSQEYRYFIDSLANEQTRKHYDFHLKKYCKYSNEDILSKKDNPRLLEAQIIQYIVSLRQQKLSHSHISCSLAAISHFYTMNDIMLNKKKIAKFLGEKTKKMQTKGKGYSREQIAKMLQICDERQKTIVFMLASTGIRIGALPELELKHIEKISDLYRITVYDGEYYTFCTPECSKAIDNYLEYRQRYGEKLTPNAPLIREMFDRDDQLKARNPKPLKRFGVITLIRDLLRKAGIQEVHHLTEGGELKTSGQVRKDIPLHHGFRKFFNTALMNSDVHPSFKKLLMGHSVQLDEVYYDKGSEKSTAKLLEEYSKAIDALTINDENRLRKKVEELTPKSDEIQGLRTQLDMLLKAVFPKNYNDKDGVVSIEYNNNTEAGRSRQTKRE
jgi:integrase